MGIAATFRVLRSLPAEEALPYFEAALAEPYPELQQAAYIVLTDANAYNRPDLVVQNFPGLLPEVRQKVIAQKWLFINVAKDQIKSGREKARRAAYEMLSVIGEVDVAPLLVMGVNDVSTIIRDNAANALEKIALRYNYHLLNYHTRGDPDSQKFVDENRGLMDQSLEVLLRTFAIHRKAIFVDIAIESGGDTYKLVTEIALSRTDSPLYRSFLHAMDAAHSDAAIDLLFKLYFERQDNLRQAALEVMKRRQDAAFPLAVGNYLAKLPPEKLLNISARTDALPWWGSVEQNPDIEPVAAAKLIEFVSKSFLQARERDAKIAAFLRSKYADVRVRALMTLSSLRSANLADLARKTLEDPSDEAKVAAARILADLNPPDRVRLFTSLMNSPCEELRRIATKEVAKESFDRYMKSFDRLDGKTRALAAKALAKIDASMVDKLSEEIYSLDAARRLKALQVIDFVDAEKDLRPVLTELLNDPDTRVRATAIKIIELSGNVEGMKLLISCLNHSDRRVRANAIEAFEEIGDTRFAQLLLPFVKDPDNRVRANAVKALWNLGRREVRDVLLEMLEDKDENMRLSAAWTIGEVRFEGAAEALGARLAAETSEKVRAKLTEVLARFAPGQPTSTEETP